MNGWCLYGKCRQIYTIYMNAIWVLAHWFWWRISLVHFFPSTVSSRKTTNSNHHLKGAEIDGVFDPPVLFSLRCWYRGHEPCKPCWPLLALQITMESTTLKGVFLWHFFTTHPNSMFFSMLRFTPMTDPWDRYYVSHMCHKNQLWLGLT